MRDHTHHFLTLPVVFSLLWAETLPEDVLVRMMELFGVERDEARQMVARYVASGWLEYRETRGTFVFTLIGPAEALMRKVMEPELSGEWPGTFQQVLFNDDAAPQPELAGHIRFMAHLAGLTEIAPGVLLGFTDMTELVRIYLPRVAPGNLLTTGTLAVSEEQARRILPVAWDFTALAGEIEEKRRTLRETGDGVPSAAEAVRRLRDLYLDRMLLIAGPGRIPEAVRPRGLGLWQMAAEYADRLDRYDDVTDPFIAAEVAACRHADLIVDRTDGPDVYRFQ